MKIEWSNKGKLSFKDGKLLFQRYGPANAQKQVHRKGNVAPVNRGIWVFPFPYGDLFFTWHIFEKRLPQYLKNSRDWPADKIKEYCKIRDDLLINIRKNIEKPKKIWWDGEIYSRIAPNPQAGDGGDKGWYYYPNAHEFVPALRKHMVCYFKGWFGEGTFYKANVSNSGGLSRDHLECFLPM